MRTYGWRRVAIVGLVAAALLCLVGRSEAEACSPGRPAETAALPAAGATNVSTATSLIVFSAAQPSGLTLLANGQNVPLLSVISLGNGVMGLSSPGGFWRVATDGMLLGGAEHVLSQATGSGTTVELTRFTTATGYDKVQGVPPVVRGVRLWRVRYPVSDIASGNCVFSEYHGFITIDYDPGTVPNTPAASVVHTFHLAPKTGGSAQKLVWASETPFVGSEPMGTYPTPTGLWQPELDPTRQYCLTISAFGDGDLARLEMTSQSACAEVVQLSVPGAGGGGGGGGCAIAGAASSAFAGWLVLVAFALGARRIRR